MLGSDVVAFGLTAVLLSVSLVLPVGPLALVMGAGLLGFHTLVLSPLYCALAVKWAADEPTRNGFLGAVLGAYGASLIAAVVNVAALLISAALVGPGYSIFVPEGRSLIQDIVLLLIGASLRYGGIPLASSWAMHLGSNPATALADPRPARWIAQITPEGRERAILRAPVVLAW